MTEVIKQAQSTIEELTSARTVQAIVTLIVTLALMTMIVLEREVPESLLYAWFALIGLYMELPGKSKTKSIG